MVLFQVSVAAPSEHVVKKDGGQSKEGSFLLSGPVAIVKKMGPIIAGVMVGKGGG